jgi:hypothetical protein
VALSGTSWHPGNPNAPARRKTHATIDGMKATYVAQSARLLYRRMTSGSGRPVVRARPGVRCGIRVIHGHVKMRTLCVQNATKNANVNFLLRQYQPLTTLIPKSVRIFTFASLRLCAFALKPHAQKMSPFVSPRIHYVRLSSYLRTRRADMVTFSSCWELTVRKRFLNVNPTSRR